MSGRAVLHGEHNAPVHDQRGPVPEPQISDEIRPEQDPETSDTENRVRVAAVDRHEPAAEPYVFKSKWFPLPIGFRLSSPITV